MLKSSNPVLSCKHTVQSFNQSKMAKLVACLAAVALLSVSHGYSVPSLNRLSESQSKFSVDLFRSIYSDNHDKNILISPYSVYRALTLAYFASNGTTEQSLARALHFEADDKSAVLESYLSDIEVRAERNQMGEAEVAVADRIFVAENTIVEYVSPKLFIHSLSQLTIEFH